MKDCMKLTIADLPATIPAWTVISKVIHFAGHTALILSKKGRPGVSYTIVDLSNNTSYSTDVKYGDRQVSYVGSTLLADAATVQFVAIPDLGNKNDKLSGKEVVLQLTYNDNEKVADCLTKIFVMKVDTEKARGNVRIFSDYSNPKMTSNFFLVSDIDEDGENRSTNVHRVRTKTGDSNPSL